MTKNRTTTAMMRSRSGSRSRMSHSPILHVFPLLPKSLFTILEDDNKSTTILKPSQGSIISDRTFHHTSRTTSCSPLALHIQYTAFSWYDSDEDDDDNGDNGSSSKSTSPPRHSHADILTSVFDTLSAFDEDDDDDNYKEDEDE